jgi:hypothetical protein
MKREYVFDTTNLREEWRMACHKLKLGMFDPKTAAIAAPNFTTSAVPLQAT